jgi:hypothetical protein
MVSIANVPEVQRELPQIFLGSARHFTGAFLAAYRPRMPDGMYLWSNERGWMTHAVCLVLLRAIHASLGTLLERYHVILLMDANRAHLDEAICRRARALGMTLVFVPAKLTWLLQPADTHLFAPLKSAVRRKYTNMQLETTDGRIDKEQWLSVVVDALSEVVVDRSWSNAFASNGITNRQPDASMYVRTMGGLSRGNYATAKPTLPELQYLFGMTNIPYASLVPDMPAPLPAHARGARRIVPRATRLLIPGEEVPGRASGSAGPSSSHGHGRGEGDGRARGGGGRGRTGRGGGAASSAGPGGGARIGG